VHSAVVQVLHEEERRCKAQLGVEEVLASLVVLGQEPVDEGVQVLQVDA